jgi:hypothetical protein
LDAGTISQESGTRREKWQLTTKVGEEPEEEGDCCAEDKAGHDREIESGVFATMDDVSGEFAEARRKLPAEEQNSAEHCEDASEDKESAAEFAKGLHNSIIEERPCGSRVYGCVRNKICAHRSNAHSCAQISWMKLRRM